MTSLFLSQWLNSLLYSCLISKRSEISLSWISVNECRTSTLLGAIFLLIFQTSCLLIVPSKPILSTMAWPSKSEIFMSILSSFFIICERCFRFPLMILCPLSSFLARPLLFSNSLTFLFYSCLPGTILFFFKNNFPGLNSTDASTAYSMFLYQNW